MYDPSLHRFVHELMRKTFIQMLAEFKRLGSSVVYADFGNIILLTSKAPGTAAAYAAYLLAAVTSNKLFRFMQLRTITFYNSLLFMDQVNLGGVVCTDPMALEPSVKINLSSVWNINNFCLHSSKFEEVVQDFILDRYRIHRKHSQSSRQPMRVLSGTQSDGTQPIDAEKVEEVAATKLHIAQKLIRRVLRNVSDIVDEHRKPSKNPNFPSNSDSLSCLGPTFI